MPDLESLESGFDAPPGEREVRVSDSVSRSTFGQTVVRAVQTHPRLTASDADIRAAQAREDGEATGYLPRFSLGATIGSGVTGGNGVAPVLQILQLIYDGGATASRQIAARARVFESRGSRLEVAAAFDHGSRRSVAQPGLGRVNSTILPAAMRMRIVIFWSRSKTVSGPGREPSRMS